MSTNWSRSRELLAHASDLSRSAAGLASASAAAGRHVPPCAEPVCHLAPVPGPNGSRIADAPRLAALLPPGERLAAAAQPPPGDAVLTSQNPAVHPLGFPCPDHSTEIQECHYIMQYSIGSSTTRAVLENVPLSPLMRVQIYQQLPRGRTPWLK